MYKILNLKSLILNLFLVVSFLALGFVSPAHANLKLADLEQQILLLNGEYSTTNTTDNPTGNDFGLVRYDPANYTGATVYFEAVLRCDSCSGGNSAVTATLYNQSGVGISTISTTESVYTRVRSGSIIMPANDYTLRFKLDATGGTAYVKSAKLIIVQTGNPITTTETQIELGHYQTSSSTSPTVLTAPKYYQFDTNQFDGTLNAYFEATFRTSGNDTTFSYEFNDYDIGGSEWSTNPANMADGNGGTFASTSTDGDIQRLTGNTATTTDQGQINLVEIRAFGYQTDGTDGQVLLTPVFGGSTSGDTEIFTPNQDFGNASYSGYYDITSHTNAPSTWTWSDIDNLDFDVEFNQGASGTNTAFVAVVQIRVSYESNAEAGYIELYNRTDGQVVATLSTSDNDYSRTRSSALTTNWDLSNSDEYQVRIYTSNASNPVYLANAKIVLNQTEAQGLEKVELVHHLITTTRTQTSSTYTQETFINLFSPNSYYGNNYLEAYLEATMYTTGGTGYVALYNNTEDDIINTPINSEITTTSATYERRRSSNLANNTDWPTTANQLTTITQATDTQTLGVSNSWIIIRAQAVQPSFSFAINGVESGQTINGITTTAASTITSIPFGYLTANVPSYVSHELNVVSNGASSGYNVYVTLQYQMQGGYPGNNIDPFVGNGATWTSPQAWITPTGTTPNIDTAWVGANITDTDIDGWSGDNSGKFGPLTVEPLQIMSSNQGNVDDTENITYGIEVNVYQPADTYISNLVYDVLPVY